MAEIVYHQNLAGFWATFFASASVTDLWGSVVKTTTFGAIIAIVCCYKGMTARGCGRGRPGRERGGRDLVCGDLGLQLRVHANAARDEPGDTGVQIGRGSPGRAPAAAVIMPPMTRVAGYVRTSAVEEGPDLSAERSERVSNGTSPRGAGSSRTCTRTSARPLSPAPPGPAGGPRSGAQPRSPRGGHVRPGRGVGPASHQGPHPPAGCRLRVGVPRPGDRHGRGAPGGCCGACWRALSRPTLLQVSPGRAGGRRGASAAIKLSPPRSSTSVPGPAHRLSTRHFRKRTTC